ncbi:MAG: helix-turn-helix transcriptional regulator [Stellaceae bacterium]
MARRPELPDVVAALYGAPLCPEAWPAALTKLGDYVGGTRVVLTALRLAGGADLHIEDSNSDPNRLALFNQRYTSPDSNPAIPALMGLAPGTIALREQRMSDAEWERCNLYNEIFRPRDLYHGLAAVIVRTGSHLVPVGVSRPKKSGPFAARDVAMLERVVPHLQRAVQVLLRLADLEARKTAYESLWDALTCGVILLDGEGLLFWANRMAAALLARGDGLSVRGGRLFAASRSESRALERLVSSAVATSKGHALMGGNAQSISRPSLARPLALLVAPMPMAQILIGHRPAAVILVGDPEQRSETAPDLIARLYDLTPREAALASLLGQGIDLHRAAERLRMSRHTTRKHLQYIFAKTDTHRQAELVRLLLGSPVGLLGSGLRPVAFDQALAPFGSGGAAPPH